MRDREERISLDLERAEVVETLSLQAGVAGRARSHPSRGEALPGIGQASELLVAQAPIHDRLCFAERIARFPRCRDRSIEEWYRLREPAFVVRAEPQRVEHRGPIS